MAHHFSIEDIKSGDIWNALGVLLFGILDYSYHHPSAAIGAAIMMVLTVRRYIHKVAMMKSDKVIAELKAEEYHRKAIMDEAEMEIQREKMEAAMIHKKIAEDEANRILLKLKEDDTKKDNDSL